MATRAPGARIDGLDAWRAILMLGGLFFHAAIWQEPRPLFGIVTLVSNSFRMGSFFLISGLLSAMVLKRREPGVWLRRRLVQIGVPTAFGLAVVCPIISLLFFYASPESSAPQRMPIDWFHLWFLAALLGYTLLSVVADAIDRRWSIAARADARYGSHPGVQIPALLGTAMLSFVLMIETDRLVATWAPVAILPGLGQCRLITGYVPVYLLGFALARMPGLRDKMVGAPLLALFVLACVALGYTALFVPIAGRPALSESGHWTPLFLLAGASLAPPAASMLILRSALAIRHVPAALQRLAEASFTIYIVHFPIVLAVSLALQRVDWSPYLEYAIAVLIGGATSYALHRWLVARSPLLLLLLNGRRRRAPQPA